MTNLNNRLSSRSASRINPKLKGLIAALVCFLCFSCQQQALYDQYQAIDNTLWEKDKEYYFTFRITDTNTPYNLTLEVRNNNKYPYQNLWIFCKEELPVGPLRKDTIECVLANEFGKWHGNGISLFQSSIAIRSNYRFPVEGQYTFSFRQGMRNDQLPGIQEIGFRVEPASPNVPSGKRPSEGR